MQVKDDIGENKDTETINHISLRLGVQVLSWAPFLLYNITMKLKISFDFDETLEHRDVQSIARELIQSGYNVCILTTRYKDVSKYLSKNASHAKLFEVAKDLGITEINFTDFKWKTTVIDSLNIDIHIDDNFEDEVIPINKNNKAIAIFYDICAEEDSLRFELNKVIKELTSP